MGSGRLWSGAGGIGCSGRLLDLRVVGLPVSRVESGQGRALRAGPDRAVELFSQDVGMPGVPVGLTENVDHDVEQLHVGARPPWHVAGGTDGKRVDRRVRVLPYAPVETDDLFASFVLGSPQVGATGGLVPPGQGFGERAAEDLTEIPGLPGRQVFDQAEAVGSGGGQGAADVVFGEPVELSEQRCAYPAQIAVQVLFRELIDHGA